VVEDAIREVQAMIRAEAPAEEIAMVDLYGLIAEVGGVINGGAPADPVHADIDALFD
jgi:hypothetical protein